jgi:hypothetical protein
MVVSYTWVPWATSPLASVSGRPVADKQPETGGVYHCLSAVESLALASLSPCLLALLV